VKGSADPSHLEQAERQTARVLSLDADAAGFLEVGQRDPVIAELQALAPGLRPPLFYSAYEAAAWSVLSARRPHQQMAEVRRRLNETYGATFDLGGEALAAFPTPEQLLAVPDFPGLQSTKIERLHGVARAALAGDLDTERLRESDPEDAMRELQRIPGIGPFYSSLVVIRAVGMRDVLPMNEPRALELIRRLYGLDHPPTQAEFERIAEPWKPWRTWTTVLVRAAGARSLT
jgi:DNA-3-methyladenine glycosylase II